MKQYMDKMFKKMAERKGTATRHATLNFVPPCIETLPNNDVVEGCRNETTAALTSYFKQSGMSEDEAWDRLLTWNEERCSPPQTVRELDTTFNSVFHKEYSYGCSRLKLIALCNQTCPLTRTPRKGAIR